MSITVRQVGKYSHKIFILCVEVKFYLLLKRCRIAELPNLCTPDIYAAFSAWQRERRGTSKQSFPLSYRTRSEGGGECKGDNPHTPASARRLDHRKAAVMSSSMSAPPPSAVSASDTYASNISRQCHNLGHVCVHLLPATCDIIGHIRVFFCPPPPA